MIKLYLVSFYMNMIYKTQGKVSGNWQREFDQDD